MLAVAQTAGAAWFGWKGSASSPSYWNVQDNWYISGSNWSKFETEACNFHINPVPSGSNIFVSGWEMLRKIPDIIKNIPGLEEKVYTFRNLRGYRHLNALTSSLSRSDNHCFIAIFVRSASVFVLQKILKSSA